MKIINEKVIELHSVLEEIFLSFRLQSTNSGWKFHLEKLIAICWLENLCILQRPYGDKVYLWNLQRKSINLLPSLASKDYCPMGLIFETLWKMRSKDYVTNIINVNKNFLEGFRDENIQMMNTSKKIMVQHVNIIRPVGHHILKTGFVGYNGLLKDILEKKLSQLVGSTVNISVFQYKSELKIQCDEQHKETVRDEIEKIITKIQNKMKKELWEFCTCKQSGMRIVLGKMAEVVHFLMPSDFMSVIVFAPTTMSTDKILQTLNKHGQILHHSENIASNNKKQINIMFNNPTSAKHALGHKEKELTTKPRLVNVCQQNEMQYFVKLKVQWARRLNLGTMTIQFDKFPSYIYHKIKCYPDSIKEYNEEGRRLILKNLDKTLSKEEIVSKIEADLIDSDIKIEKCRLLQEPGFQSSLEDLNKIKNKLRGLVTPIFGKKNVEILVKEPNLKDDTWTATVSSNKFQESYSLLNSISQKTLDGRLLRVTVNYFCSIFCGPELFETVKNAFQTEMTKRRANAEEKNCNMQVQTTTEENNGKIAVQIVGDDLEEVMFCYQCLASRLRSYTFNVFDYELLTKKLYDDDERQQMLNKFAKNANAFVGYNIFSNQISVVNNSEVIENLHRQLQLENAKSELLDKIFNCNSPAGTIRELVKLYNPKLTVLKKITGADHVELNITSKNIQVKGDDKAVNMIEGILKSIAIKLNTPKVSNIKRDSIDICVICSDDVDNADYNYRVENCGHAYCFPCVTALIANSNPPIFCLFKGCSKPIVSRDLIYLHQECPLAVKNLAEKATFQYLKKNMTAFLFCVLPDCDGILSRSDKENYCVKCFNKICIGCEVLYHYGETCEEYKKKHFKTIIQKSQVKIDAVPSMASTNVTVEKSKKTDSFEITQSIFGPKSRLAIMFPKFPPEDSTIEVSIEKNTSIKSNTKPHYNDLDLLSSSIFTKENSNLSLKSAPEYNFKMEKQTALKKLQPMYELDNSLNAGDKTHQSNPSFTESSNKPTFSTAVFVGSSSGVGYLPTNEASRSSGINSNSYSPDVRSSSETFYDSNSTKVNYSTVKSETYSNQESDSIKFYKPKLPKNDDKCMMM